MTRYEYLNETRKLLEAQLAVVKKPEQVVKLTIWLNRIEDEMTTLIVQRSKAS